MSRIALLLALGAALVVVAPAAGRLDGTAARVTNFERPATLAVGQRPTLYGSGASQNADEIVTIQVRPGTSRIVRT